MPQGVLREDGQIGDAAAEVDEGHAQLLLFVGEHRFACGQALQGDAVDLQAGPVGALENIIQGSGGAGDDVDLALQAHPVDAHRVLDAVLAVDQKFLHQGVDHLPVRGDGHGAGRVDDPFHVRRGHLPVLDGNDPLAVDHLGLAAPHAGINGTDFAAGHGFRFLHGLADGPDGVFNVDHHPFAEPAVGGGAPQADDIHLVFPHFPHHGANFGGADVQTDD